MNQIGADSSSEERQLFQAGDGGSQPTSALHFVIHPINHATAKLWVEKWHYSKRIPTGENHSFGLYADDLLYAVIVYGVGVNPYQAKFLKVENVVELKRMVRSEPPMNYPLSRFIALTLRMLKKIMKFQAVVAFADPEHDHKGTVYKACGFTLEGTTNPEWHLEDSDGDVRHRRFAFRYARRNGMSVKDAREQLKVKRVQTLPKFRWVKRFT